MNKRAQILKILLSFSLVQNGASFALPNPHSFASRRQQVNVDPGRAAVEGLHHQRHPISHPQRKSITEVRGGTSVDSTSSGNDAGTEISLYQKWSQFANKNFFLLGMFVAVGLARAFPLIGKSGGTLRADLFIGKFGVACIFLLSGLSLELSELKQAASNHKLNGSVLLTTFGLWPLLVGLPLTKFLASACPNLLTAPLRDGLLILTCLPTTVNMCVILTTAAGGSVASALFNAVISNLAGIFVTPMLLLRFFGKYIQLPFLAMLVKLCGQVLLPVAVGQGLRLAGGKAIYSKHSKFFKRSQEVILLGIVWNSFCNAFSSGVSLELRHALTLLTLIPAMHLLSLGVLFKAFSLPIFNFSRKETIAAMFAASHKTLAFGLPLINTIFEGSPNIASYCTPLMFIHPIQLILGSLCAPALAKYVEG